jgi:hypothetical protein
MWLRQIWIEPLLLVFEQQDDWHPVMDSLKDFSGSGGDSGAYFELDSSWRAPYRPP